MSASATSNPRSTAGPCSSSISEIHKPILRRLRGEHSLIRYDPPVGFRHPSADGARANRDSRRDRPRSCSPVAAAGNQREPDLPTPLVVRRPHDDGNFRIRHPASRFGASPLRKLQTVRARRYSSKEAPQAASAWSRKIARRPVSSSSGPVTTLFHHKPPLSKGVALSASGGQSASSTSLGKNKTRPKFSSARRT